MSTPEHSRFPELIIDLVIAALTFAVLGVVGALVWNGVVDLPRFTRTADGATMDALELSGMFAINGWFAMIGAVAALVAGAALLVTRHREPVWMVVAIGAASLLGGWLMDKVGEALGPGDPAPILRGAKVGVSAPVQLHLSSNLYLFAWLAGAVLGTVLVLLFVTPRDHSDVKDASGPDPEPVSTAAGDLA